MVSDGRTLGFVSTDDGHIVERALLSSFIDNSVTACSELLIQDEVLHPLWKRNKRSALFSLTILISWVK